MNIFLPSNVKVSNFDKEGKLVRNRKAIRRIAKELVGLLLKINFLGLVILTLTTSASAAQINYTNDQIANAIYKAEGGAKTSHPYGILAHYQHTTPRQACINTIKHARRDFQGGDFIEFLGDRYCPVGAANDPRGLNKNWVKNVKYFLLEKRS
jgi:hypothetical protein